MNDSKTLTAQIERGLDMAADIVGAITEDQWTAATPCAGWTAHDVMNHLVGGMRIFTAELTGQEPEADHESDWLGDDPLGAFVAAASADRAAWRRPDALVGTVTISLGQLPGPMAAVVHLTELVVHGVDLAVAAHQVALIDQALCEDLLAMMRGMGGIDAFRMPGVFGPELVSDETAPAYQRLAAFLGRDLTVVTRVEAAR
jgi:uncharacterized protein (TIGR03086 family)